MSEELQMNIKILKVMLQVFHIGIKDVVNIFAVYFTKDEKFIIKLGQYKPREFILENLSMEICYENGKNYLMKYK